MYNVINEIKPKYVSENVFQKKENKIILLMFIVHNKVCKRKKQTNISKLG